MRISLGRQPVLSAVAAALLVGFATCGTAAGQSWRQGAKCTDRDINLPASGHAAMVADCRAQAYGPRATNEDAANAFYHAGRAYNATGDHLNAATQILESIRRLPDVALPARNKGNKRTREANDRFRVGRGYELAVAYEGLSKATPPPSAAACAGKEDCLRKAVAELNAERQEIARSLPANAARPGFDDFVYLRAMSYMDLDETVYAKRDLEEIARPGRKYEAAAKEQLGNVYIREGRREMRPPVSAASLNNARAAFRSALGIDAVALDGQLSLAETYLLEARLGGAPAERRQKYVAAQSEYGKAIAAAQQKGRRDKEAAALEGRGTAYLEQSSLEKVDEARLLDAISDLEKAAGIDTTKPDPQLKYAQALALAGRDTADAAFTEAMRRLGSDPRAANVRTEQAFFKGKRYFGQAQFQQARSSFNDALADSRYRTEAYYYLSVLDLRLADGKPPRPVSYDAVRNADSANNGDQACLARIVHGGDSVLKQTGLGPCAGSDLLQGMFHLRHAQLAPGSSRQSRIDAQAAFHRALSSSASITQWPGANEFKVKDLAELGKAIALSCASGLPVQANLDTGVLAAAQEYFRFYRVQSCRAG